MGKGLIRSLNRSSTASGKATAAARTTPRPPEPAACERCGAVYVRRKWRRGGTVTPALLGRAAWLVCPACQQVRAGRYFGRLLIRGELAPAEEELVRRRIRNVAARAASSQPQRRIVAIAREADGLEVLTTSQKLAHRIAHELRKALGGTVRYAWSDDRSLLARWEPRRARAPRSPRGRRAR